MPEYRIFKEFFIDAGNEDEAFIDTLVEMLAEPHQDLEWNEKFKAVVRKHFEI